MRPQIDVRYGDTVRHIDGTECLVIAADYTCDIFEYLNPATGTVGFSSMKTHEWVIVARASDKR